MSNTKAILAAVAAGSLAAAGGAFAASQGTAPNGQPTPQAALQTDFSKLSADGSKAFQDLRLTRLAIYDGDTAKAKSLVDDAATAFAKTKGDDTVFMKAERELMTPEQMAARQGAKQGPANQAAAQNDEGPTAKQTTAKQTTAKQTIGKQTIGKQTTAQQTAGEQTVTMTKQGREAEQASQAPARQGADASGSAANAKPQEVAWLPVDGAVSLDEDYTMNPTKAKAVSDANKALAKGDSKGAIDRLKLGDVNMSVALEVVPLQSTIDDVHQAASLIDSGKYYEGSQTLRKVQTSARYDLIDYLATPNGKLATSHATDTGSRSTTN